MLPIYWSLRFCRKTFIIICQLCSIASFPDTLFFRYKPTPPTIFNFLTWNFAHLFLIDIRMKSSSQIFKKKNLVKSYKKKFWKNCVTFYEIFFLKIWVLTFIRISIKNKCAKFHVKKLKIVGGVGLYRKKGCLESWQYCIIGI